MDVSHYTVKQVLSIRGHFNYFINYYLMSKFKKMKTLSVFKFIFFVSVTLLFVNCRKQQLHDSNDNTETGLVNKSIEKKQERPFKGTFSTYFNFEPDIPGGWTPPNPAPAWYPGGGSGNLTHMGNCFTYFNQYATFGASGLQSVAAPVNQFFASQLAVAGFTVPNTVSTIYYNNLYFLSKTGNSTSTKFNRVVAGRTTRPIRGIATTFRKRQGGRVPRQTWALETICMRGGRLVL